MQEASEEGTWSTLQLTFDIKQIGVRVAKGKGTGVSGSQAAVASFLADQLSLSVNKDNNSAMTLEFFMANTILRDDRAENKEFQRVRPEFLLN